ncbi:MAG: hypothetical protein JWM12_1537 [Ilumatobacteraceae bacterium]|nr:hypothetical protein [Ilumatobacteraceae bacterium]
MTTDRFDVYGFEQPDVDEVAAAVETLLGIELRRRDSSYRGLYYVAGSGNQDYIVQVNDPQHGGYAQFSQYPVVLMVSAVPGMAAIHERLTAAGAVLLRSTTHAQSPDADPT